MKHVLLTELACFIFGRINQGKFKLFKVALDGFALFLVETFFSIGVFFDQERYPIQR